MAADRGHQRKFDGPREAIYLAGRRLIRSISFCPCSRPLLLLLLLGKAACRSSCRRRGRDDRRAQSKSRSAQRA
jgi:hypothetical protein